MLNVKNANPEQKHSSVDVALKKRFKKKDFVKVILRSCDSFVLDKSAMNLVNNVKRIIGSGAVVGPIPLPRKRRVWTILSSPHIDKKARQQLSRIVKSRLIELPASKDVMNMLDGNCSIPASVEIEIKA
ncbi:30S ribosomal protein S10 [Candidatus Cytomitobacter indipagum]|uniref:Small ribosomal subunit protein uS10 n=1 Tax=Candidatus Cytomitobacter indipagum TaxID=2601575 RepID=A0A5C0UE21_9PROT|nr:30S ribosomal protein S10 [Candidatus Cytomitobacter indipagum]QEK38278.1 30S ribosomal protein S10 [Candidatus Cytomitobacter indipagum]